MTRLFARMVAVGLVAGVSLLLSAHDGTAQEMALVTRGPKFLVPGPSTGSQPVEVDAARVTTLRRKVSLDLNNVRLSDALDAIGRQAGIHFVYVRSVLPADSLVQFSSESITVAAALTELLLDAHVNVLVSGSNQIALVRGAPAPLQTGVVAGRVTDGKTGTALAGATVVLEGTPKSATAAGDGRYRIIAVAPGTYTVRARYIGYAPGSASVTVAADQEATADLALDKSTQRLDEVVTTGTVVPTEVKALTTPITVITSEDLTRDNVQRVDQVFRGQVPGGIAWDFGPSDIISEISVRGSSSLSVSPSIKTFVDGVELASSQYITAIDPTSIDRIEITRGPQASTLYGAGALNGVMQIFTKKGQLGLHRPEVIGKLSVGSVTGFNGQSAAVQTDNSVSILGGGNQTSYSLNASYRHIGDWVPNYRWNDWGLAAGTQTTQGPLTLSGSARYAGKYFDAAWDTRFRSLLPFSQPPYSAQRLRQQTYGLTATLQATRTWQHTLTLGYDQNYDANYNTQPRFTTPADSFLSLTTFHDARTSLLYHTDLSLALTRTLAAVVTAGVNYQNEDTFQASTANATTVIGTIDGAVSDSRRLTSGTGYFGQAQISLADRLFLTGGVRAETNDNFGESFGTAWSPRVGAAYSLRVGRATAKFRASYGESIRAPFAFERNGSLVPGFLVVLPNAVIAPERQRGGDGGVDLYLGRASLGVTYYSQRATDLIELVQLPTPPGGLLTFQSQNLSRVRNYGWELEAHLPLGPVQVGGTFSITNSTVQGLPAAYTGDYQVGDQVLGIPHTSGGATVTYTPLSQTTVTASLTYFGHWINMDNVAYYGFLYGGQPYRGSTRDYWLQYPTVTKLSVGVSQGFTRSVTAFVRAENIGNSLRAEETNVNLSTPRSLLVGATVRY